MPPLTQVTAQDAIGPHPAFDQATCALIVYWWPDRHPWVTGWGQHERHIWHAHLRAECLECAVVAARAREDV